MASKNPSSGSGSRAAIDALLEERRSYHSSNEFRDKATIRDESIYAQAAADPEGFWGKVAGELDWFVAWNRVLEWKVPDAKWFTGGKLNVSYNCLDRHIRGARRNKAALIWVGEPGDRRTLTYWDLYREVNKFANALRKLGVAKGDRVALYMPMVPELPIAMLACSRLGAVHSVVFGGFSAEALRDRINDAQAKVLITADGGWRRGQIVPLKRDADEALQGAPTIEHVVVVKRGDFAVHMNEGRDHWWHRLMDGISDHCWPEPMDAEDMLYILYTSGTTGKPKGIVHTTGGYLTGVYATTKWVFDLKEEDVFWCTADIGWVTGHSYVVYGPLANGATVVMYEGSPDWPDKDRFWQICEELAVTVFYTAPTAIRAFMKWGTEWPKKHRLVSLRLLGTVGEPINPEAWVWYHEHIGGGNCPVVDTWWQTETGMILISPLPGITALKPGSATRPLPGIEADVVNEQGESVKVGGGYLVLRRPWPAMLRGIYGDPERYRQQYWSRFPGVYFTGDGAKRDADGYLWLLGRVDDVMNVAGHRISTMEVESALVDHPSVAEAAVVGRNHDLKGTAISAFVTIKEGKHSGADLADELKEHVVKKIGKIARPEEILFTADLPKTRSGKIMRRLLRDIAEGKAVGDTTTLADPAVITRLKTKYEEQES
ncbi:MAG: acetate--CoA ligase [Candidatus Eisenbacteria bacterium]|uniref:Acetyl-coenzyme A synthetase n=1 Tax=Eiseniibacteriota bacterium TaxID=2212470 RepID=A0A538TBM5_UNCEI|nr:MAG: acetate--CoA ligase [Candidatus Eisenbacteria bacterium]